MTSGSVGCSGVAAGVAAIGIDVGGTKVSAGVVDERGRIQVRWERHRTPDTADAGLVPLLGTAVAELGADLPTAPVGVGVAGIVRWPDGEIEYAANHGHGGLKLGQRLAKLTRRAVRIENDANAAAWSEAGTARVADEGVLFLSVGTGLGSGFLINGAVMRGQGGRGAELGHVIADRASGKRCTCGLVGCLEALASGWALERDGRTVVATDPTGPLARRLGRPASVDTRAMIDAALAGDPQAVTLVATMGAHLGRVIGESMMSLLPVDRVVVGGGLATLDRLLIDPMRGACQKAVARSGVHSAPRFGRSTFGDDAVIVGSAQLARERLSGPVHEPA